MGVASVVGILTYALRLALIVLRHLIADGKVGEGFQRTQIYSAVFRGAILLEAGQGKCQFLKPALIHRFHDDIGEAAASHASRIEAK